MIWGVYESLSRGSLFKQGSEMVAQTFSKKQLDIWRKA